MSLRGISEPLGTPSEFARMVGDFRAIGLTEVTAYWPPTAESEAAREAIAREALPELRGA